MTVEGERLDLTGEAGAILDRALREDAAGHDVTSEAIFPPEHRSVAVVRVREPCVVAGIPVVEAVYRRLPGGVVCEPLVDEGASANRDDPILRLRGGTVGLLAGERTALNFLQRLSGIATVTRALVDRVAGSGIVLLDTRKTTPGLRAMEKYAVRAGGGRNHRMHLADMILVKENHADAVGGLRIALERVRSVEPDARAIEVEVRGLEELEVVLPFGVGRVLLDNFSPGEVRRAVRRLRECPEGTRPDVEVSGGITAENIDAYRIEGVDCISMGALTHTVRAIDMSMCIEAGPDRG